MLRFVMVVLVLVLPAPAFAGYVTTFENIGLPANSFNNNAGPSGAFVVGGNSFNNQFSTIPGVGGVWSGWAMSTMTDTTTPGFANQFSAIPGSGANGSKTYAVGFTWGTDPPTDPKHPSDSIINLATGTRPLSIQVTNTTYAYLSMLNGDQFAHKFGPGDFLLLTVTGYNSLNGVGQSVGQVDFYLANFLGANRSIVNTWQTVNLASLAGAKSLRFGLESSDNDPTFGMNTPAYFAADNLAVTPEPAAGMLALLGAVGLGMTALRRRRTAALA